MLGWLAKKGENARVYMCVKEVLWDLERADGLRRATLLMLAQWFRLTMTEDGGLPNNLLDRPLDYTRADLVQFYGMLETIRNNAVRQNEHLQKTMPRLGIKMPDFAVQHVKDTNRGIEIWMCTVGCGIAPDVRDDVRKIWQHLGSSHQHIRDAMLRLKSIEVATQELTGEDTSMMFDAVPLGDWLIGAEFVPGAFKADLRLS